MRKFYYSILLFGLLAVPSFGQSNDSLKTFTPTGIRVGVDLISPVRSISDDSYAGYEAVVDVDFYRYLFVAEFGSVNRKIDVANGDYQNDGSFYRVGVDVNFLINDPDQNIFFIGFRYGNSSFNEHLSFISANPNYSDSTFLKNNVNMRGAWGEVTSGLKVKIWKGLFMGFTGRFKFAPGTKGSPEFIAYDMPGYGLVSQKIYWGFSYQVFWRIPFRK